MGTLSFFRASWGGLFETFYTFKGTRDVASIAAGAEAVETFTVPGVALGDIVVGFSFGVSLAGLNANAYVSAANTVTIQLGNATAGAIDLASTTVQILVARPNGTFFA